MQKFNTLSNSLLTPFLFLLFLGMINLSCEEETMNPDSGSGMEMEMDDTDCPNDNSITQSDVGCTMDPMGLNQYEEEVNGNGRRVINSNSFPNHNFDLRPGVEIVPIERTFRVDAQPSLASSKTSVLRPNGRPALFYGVALNGVILAPAPAEPFIFENTETGEYNWDWVFEPTNNRGFGQGLVSLDCASAHVGPQGYHYHGNMFEYAESLEGGISTSTTPPQAPIQIAWAADGFPVLYRFGPDGQGGLALLQPSYRLKEGMRPGNGISAPCGSYSGKYTDDYEFVSGLGDLDECNGIERDVTLPTSQGDVTFPYFYVITDNFPEVGRCLSGTPDPSF